MFFKKVEIYSGWNLNAANRVMDCLRDNQIPFDFHMKDQTNRMLGRGTTRSNFGSAGIRQDYQVFYTVKVRQKDEYKAKQKLKDASI